MGKNGKGSGHKLSRINQSTCSKCGRAFWRWESKRTECLLCKPLSPRETQRTLKAAGCDQPAVLVAQSRARGSHLDQEQVLEAQAAKRYSTKLLQTLFSPRPS